MESSTVILLCVFAVAAAQYNAYPMWGAMSPHMMSSSMWRGQGSMMPWMNPVMSGMSNMAGMSSVPSMGLWRSHALYRMAAPPATASVSPASPAAAAAVAAATPSASSVPSSSEKIPLLTIPENVINIPKVPSSDEILTHMVLSNPNPKPYMDTISDFLYSPEAPKARAFIAPVYMTGMAPVMRSSGNVMDDCSQQDMAQMQRWNRDMSEWVY